jgi:colicin import membrane protein
MSTYEIPQQSSEQFYRAIYLSLGFHVFIVVAFTVKTVFFPHESLTYENAVRVDLVALPDKLVPQLSAEEISKIESKIEKKASKDKAVNLNKTKKTQKDAFKKLREMEALEKIKKEVDLESRKKRVSKLFKGNQLSSGSELTGIVALQHENYIAEVKKHIYKYWSLPEWLSNKHYKTKVLVKFDERGLVVYKKIIKSSGHPEYDDATLAAIEKASPAPAPPEKLANILAVEGVLIGFPE